MHLRKQSLILPIELKLFSMQLPFSLTTFYWCLVRQEASTPASTRSASCATPARSALSRRSRSISRQEASTPRTTRSAPRATSARSASASSRRSRSITSQEASTPKSTCSALRANTARSASASNRRSRSITRQEASTPRATPARSVSALKRTRLKSSAAKNKSVSFFSRTHPSVNSLRVIISGDDSGESGSKNGTNDGGSNDDYDPKRTREQRSPQKRTHH